MLNRVDRQYGYLSENIDVLEDNPVIILREGDYLPSIEDLNSKLEKPLPTTELQTTVFRTIIREEAKRNRG